MRQAQSERDGGVTSNKASLLCTWEIKAIGVCFFSLQGCESNTKFIHSCLTANTFCPPIYGTLHVGIGLYQYIFYCEPLRHIVGKLIQVTFRKMRRRKNKLAVLRNNASCDDTLCLSNIYVKCSSKMKEHD